MKTPHVGGMQFGLWVEPEMVNPDSDLYRAHRTGSSPPAVTSTRAPPVPAIARGRSMCVRARWVNRTLRDGPGGVTFWRA